MGKTKENFPNLKSIAREILETIENIASIAGDSLAADRGAGANTLANPSDMRSEKVARNLKRLSMAMRESYEDLAVEPAIARVVAVDEDTDEEHTYYICRTMPVSGIPNLASYRAPIGRLAALPIKEGVELEDGRYLIVVEKAQLKPHELVDGWDSRETILQSEEIPILTLRSLRELLADLLGKLQEEAIDEHLLQRFLEEEGEKAGILEGLRRGVITKMGLRDQPILDQYQDEIFRLPIDRRLLLLGPPGTGKTTTLIRRLGQKIDQTALDDSEVRVLEVIQSATRRPHVDSWLMFTPTALLRQYLKEAFSRERVPAPDERIVTWADSRRTIARDAFGLLKKGKNDRGFVLKDRSSILQADTAEQSIAWFDDFASWEREAFLASLKDSAEALKKHAPLELRPLALRLELVLTRARSDLLAPTFERLVTEQSGAQATIRNLAKAANERIDRSLNLAINRDPEFRTALVQAVARIRRSSTADTEGDEDLGRAQGKSGFQDAVERYRQAMRLHAQAIARRKSLGANSISAQLVAWLGDRLPSPKDLAELGTIFATLADLRSFESPLNAYLEGLPMRYRAFRRERQRAGTWYKATEIGPNDLHPLELDLILLAILRISGELLTRQAVLANIESAAWSPLKPALGLYRNQILVDEATDFSPVQLACMAALSHPQLRSIFACGDFNQRLTGWGARSAEDMTWIFGDMDIREVTVTYRQTQQLNDLARAMVAASGGREQVVALPEHVDSDGVAPALLENAPDPDDVVDWLAERIREIEQFVERLPSTAIFVSSEDHVGPLANALNDSLSENNIQAVPCRDGQVMGQDHDVRVFDVQHIKGLEFEAVFFVGVDRLASMHPDLFDKYLYVGTTRAATYLGLTCETVLPAPIEVLRPHFVTDWQATLVAA